MAVLGASAWALAPERIEKTAAHLGALGGTLADLPNWKISAVDREGQRASPLATTMPLQLQVLIEHFDAECRSLDRTAMVVADWSSHHFDQHASQCVASFAASRKLAIHPCVYYASSHSNEGIQVADLLADIRRRTCRG